MPSDNEEQHHSKFREPPSIWDIYNKQAQKRDDYLAEDWKSGIGNLLIFAGIFAAAVTSLCVETRRMLEADPQVSTQTILLAIAAKMDNSSLAAVPALDYEPEPWQIQINYLFFVSLTASLVASLGGIICLQWVGGYTDGLETGGDARMRALQRHSRYRAANKWYMRHFIVGLHLLLFCAVIFFLAGLSLWFWHIYRPLASIPLLGLLLWVVGYLITTLLAAVHPFAPYRNSISRTLFRILSMLGYWWWSVRNIFPCVLQALYRVSSQGRRIPHSYREWKGISGAWASFWEEFRLDQTLAVQSFVKRVTIGYPWDPAWMASSKTYWMAMHSSLWELGEVNKDTTLPLATLAWLARTLGQTKAVTNDLTMLMKELSRLKPAHLQKWRSSHFNAPWMLIINSLLRHRYDDPETREAVADVLLKMSNNPKLFERLAVDMERHTVEFFLHELAATPLRGQQSRASIQHYEICAMDTDSLEQAIIKEAENRLSSLTAVLASNLWITGKQVEHSCALMVKGDLSTQKSPSELIPSILLDALERCNCVSPTDATTLWVFTIYKTADPTVSVAPPSREQVGDEEVFRWPNPLVYDFPWRAFGKASLRIQAITHYIAFLELYLTGNQIEIPGMQLQWQVPAKEPTTTKILTEILTHHLLRLHANTRILPHPDDPSGSLLVNLQSRLTSPALKLICSVMDLNRLFLDIEIPKHDQKISPDAQDTIWQDADWKQAVLFWCGVRPGWENDACVIQDANEGVIQKAFSFFETMVCANDPCLNNAAEALIYRLAGHLGKQHWIQFISVFFYNTLEGYPATVCSQVIGLLLRLSPTSATDRLRETIYEKIIVPSRRAKRDPLQLQMEKVSGGNVTGVKPGVTAWYRLVNDYSMERRIREIGRQPKLQFQVDDLLGYIRQLLQFKDDMMDLETSYLSAIVAILDAATHQYIRLARRQERLEENTLRRRLGKHKWKLGMEKLQQEISERSLSFRTVETIAIDLASEAKEQIRDRTGGNSRFFEGPGIRRELQRRQTLLRSIQVSLYSVENMLRKARGHNRETKSRSGLVVQDPCQMKVRGRPLASIAMERTSLKVKDIPLLVETHWEGWMDSLRSVKPLGYMEAQDPHSRCRWDLP